MLIGFGGYGGVLPAISLGAGLRRRGHRVTVIAQPIHKQTIAWNDLEFVALTDIGGYRRSLIDKPLQSTRFRDLYTLRYCVDWNYSAVAALSDFAKEDVIVAAVDRSSLWADLFAEAFIRIPVLRLQPDLPQIVSGVHSRNNATATRLGYSCEVKWRSLMQTKGIHVGPRHLERLRSRRNRVPTLCLWPAWMIDTPLPAEFPCFGFLPLPRLPEVDTVPMANAGVKRRIVFVAGSIGTTKEWEAHFVEVGVEVCRRLNCSGTLIGAEADRSGLPPWFEVRKFVPIDVALSGAAAIVHHGGIGTAAAAIQHGVPQLVIPRVFGQPSNAEWLRRAGVALLLQPEQYALDYVLPELARLLSDGRFEARGRELCQRLDPAANLSRLCDFFETIACGRQTYG